MNRVTIPSKFLGDSPIISPWDFISLLKASETISTATVTATVYSGTDASPNAIISGAASFSGTVVSQKVTGGVLGVIYELLCTITTSLGQTLQMSGYFTINPDLP